MKTKLIHKKSGNSIIDNFTQAEIEKFEEEGWEKVNKSLEEF
jgi:hypothetical protein